MADTGFDSHAHDDHDDHGGVKKYVMVFVALCVLTAISFGISITPALMRAPSIGWSGMMAVSCGKALLVILFFMHLKWEANWKYVLTVPASIMSIFLMLMLVPDIGWRTDKYTESRWSDAAVPQKTQEIIQSRALLKEDGQKANEPAKAH